MPRRLFWKWVTFFSVLAIPAMLYARAGGGQSFSGGSGGGGGHGGGGSGDGGGLWLVFQLFRLCFYHPVIGIPLLLVIVAFFYYAGRSGTSTYQSATIRKAAALQDSARMGDLAAEIQSNDPQFNADAFIGRATLAFNKIQLAWANQDLAPVRPFISDAVYERFSLQFEEQQAFGYRNRMDQVAIESATLTHAQVDEQFDELSVRIAARAIDQNVSLKDGKVISGSSAATPFAEIWTFLRRRGAQTNPDKPGLIEGNCPNCGGLIELNQSANCKYCSALLRSGQFDWVLSTITQAIEWQPSERQSVPGIAEIQKSDPQFNAQELEDKASVIFWRRLAAARLGKITPLKKVALPEFCQAYESELRGVPGQPRTFFAECGVGSVRTLGILTENPGISDGTFDRALIEVTWSGTRFIQKPDGKIVRGEASAVSHLLMVLARKKGVHSNPDKSISSAHCPTCGAPESGGASPTCDFCGAILNDGSASWSLEETTYLSSDRGRELLKALPEAPMPDYSSQPDEAGYAEPPPLPVGGPPPSPVSTLAWMVKMTLADGQIDAREREMLMEVAGNYGIGPERVEAMLAAAQSGTLDIPEPRSDAEAKAQLKAIIKVALADGQLTKSEYTLLQSTAAGLRLADLDLDQMIKRTKAELYAQAKAVINTSRRTD